MCKACFGDNKIKTKTTFTVDYKDCIIVIKNVPCLECEICGEVTFTDEVHFAGASGHECVRQRPTGEVELHLGGYTPQPL